MKFKKLSIIILFSLFLLTNCYPNEFHISYNYDTYQSFITAIDNIGWEQAYKKHSFLGDNISENFVPTNYNIGGMSYNRNAKKTTKERPFMDIESITVSYTISAESLEKNYLLEVAYGLGLPDIDLNELSSDSFDIEYQHQNRPNIRSLFDIYVTIDGKRYKLCHGRSNRFVVDVGLSKEQIETIYHEFYESYIKSFKKITIITNRE